VRRVAEERRDYYEIQLDNKQLVFLFLLAVVVCGIFFLVGVKVGKDAARLEFEANKVVAQAQKLERDKAVPPSIATTPQKEPEKDTEFGYFKLVEEKKKKEPEKKPELQEKKAQATEEKEKKPVVVSSKPTPKGKWYSVQVASTRSQREAASLSDRLKRKGYSAFIEAVETKGQRFYKVRVGRFNSQVEAVSLRDTLRIKEGFRDAWVVASS
jgi:cell division septation protein DedD